MTHLYARLSGALLLFLLLAVPAQAADTIPTAVVDGAVVWTPDGPYATALLAVTSPSGLEYRRAFTAGEAVRLDPSAVGEAPMADGFYAYELVVAETVPDGDEPTAVRMQRGTLEVRGGVAVASPLLDQVINDDLIVVGSTCTGFDCNNGENFGFDTLRLKENNLRLHFQDTSNSASFPSNDWRIVINDSSNGGGNYFAIEDSDANRQPFRIDAGASVNSIRVRSNGDVGFGIAIPVVKLHAAEGDSPTLRLEQNGSSGFTPQTWDVAGNETNFFIRDATNGSTLPFRIKPTAPSNAIVIDASGDVAIGSNGAGVDFSGNNHVLAVANNGVVPNAANPPRFAVTDAGRVTALGSMAIGGSFSAFGDFASAPAGNALNVQDLPTNTSLFNVKGDGTVNATGEMNAVAFNPSSDATMKENVVPVDADAVLEGVASLSIATWEFIADTDDALHLGPMAQDFAATFGLGAYDTRIATVDADGVALASIQALHARSEAATARIAELEAANAALEARLARLEALLSADHE